LDTKYRRAKTKLKDLKSHKNSKTLTNLSPSSIDDKEHNIKKIIQILNNSDLNKNEFLIFFFSKLTQAYFSFKVLSNIGGSKELISFYLNQGIANVTNERVFQPKSLMLSSGF
jgi:hypothetical protein